MRRFNRISTTILVYGVMAVIVAPLYMWGNLSITILIAQAVAIFLLSDLLARNLPRSIRSAQTFNCRRRDGTWSIAREQEETDAVGRLRRELLFAVALVVVLTTALLSFVHTEIVPLDVTLTVVSSGEFSPEGHSRVREATSPEFTRWGQMNGLTKDEIKSRHRFLCKFWPAFVFAGLGWTALGLSFIKNGYFRALKDMSEAIEFRRLQHHMRDLNRAVDQRREFTC